MQYIKINKIKTQIKLNVIVRNMFYLLKLKIYNATQIFRKLKAFNIKFKLNIKIKHDFAKLIFIFYLNCMLNVLLFLFILTKHEIISYLSLEFAMIHK